MKDRVSELALEILACVCHELSAEGRPVCHCALWHGATVPPADWCACDCGSGEGQAWVRVNGIQAVHASQSAKLEVCRIDAWRVQFEIGVFRCVNSALDEMGHPPSEQENNTDALNAYQDAAILRKVVLCCDALDHDRIVGMRIDGWNPLGPAGNCAGGALSFVIEL